MRALVTLIMNIIAFRTLIIASLHLLIEWRILLAINEFSYACLIHCVGEPIDISDIHIQAFGDFQISRSCHFLSILCFCTIYYSIYNYK